MVEPRTRPVHVGRQLLPGHHDPLDRLGDLFPAVLLDLPGKSAAVLLEDRGPGIRLLVDTMAESHDPLVPGQGIVNPAIGNVGRTHALQDLPGFLVGPAVKWTLERADRRHDSRIDVRQGGHRDPGREGGRVELVLGVQDQRGIERPAQGLRGNPAGDHLQEVGGVVESGVGSHRGLPRAPAFPVGDRCRHPGDHPLGLADVGGMVGGRGADLGVEMSQDAH